MPQLDMFSLDGLVAVIPGGGGGIGSAMATGFARAGARVAVVGRTRESLDVAVEGEIAAGGEAIAVVADVTDETEAARMAGEVVDRFGRVDILVNAVGGGAGKVLFDA